MSHTDLSFGRTSALFVLNPGAMSKRPNLGRDHESQGQRGFTLVEALLVMVMVGILLAIAVPRFAEARIRLQLDTAAHQLAGDLRRTQVEAIKRNQTVELATTGASTYNIQSVPTLLVPLVTVFNARSFEGNVTFAAGSAASVRMASFGPPVTGAAVFIVETVTGQKTITVSAAGLVSVQ
jgi:prepilin-type N-terminal cleavage/methylation domain-containing protein